MVSYRLTLTFICTHEKKYACILPGFAGLEHAEESGKVVHAAALGSQLSVLFISLFLFLRVACRQEEISLHTTLLCMCHFLTH